MIDILLRDGDLVADRYGDILLCHDESEDIIQTANNNILLRYKGNKFHNELGNRVYNNRIKSNEGGIAIIQSECINAIMNDPRVRDVSSIDVTILEDAMCKIDYVLTYAKTIEIPVEDNEDEDMDTTDTNPDVDVDVDTDINLDEDEDIEVLDAVDMLVAYDEPEEVLIEVHGKAYINAFNI